MPGAKTLPAPAPAPTPRQGRPPLPESERRSCRIILYVTPADHAELADRAAVAGKASIADYVRTLVAASRAGL